MRGNGAAWILAVGLGAACALSACGSPSVPASPGVSCANYVLHGAGQYHNEESVRVRVSNSAAHALSYQVVVTLTGRRNGPGTAATAQITISGSVAPRSSGELARKVLTAGPVERCQLTRVTSQGGS